MQAGLTRISLSNAPQTGVSNSYYGSFYDTTRQTIGAPYAIAQIELNTTVFNQNIQIASGTQIVFDYAGKYNIEFSLQLQNLSNQEQDFYLWLDYLGSAVSNSASVVSVPKQHAGGDGFLVPAWNFYVNVNAGDNVELVWTASSTQVRIEPVTPPVPQIPSIPSVIVTVSKI